MDALFLVIFILDGLVIGYLLALLCQGIFGNKPFARLLKLLISIIGGGAYALWALYTGYEDSEISMIWGCIIIFAPIILLAMLWVVYYMFKDEE